MIITPDYNFFNNYIYKMSLNYNISLNHKEILNHSIVKGIYQKCNIYKNSIFNNYDLYEYDTVYAIGDIHGDYNAFIQILNYIGCINIKKDEIHWNPKSKNICIVQVGDIMDGYKPKILKYNSYTSEDLKIIEIMLNLSDEAIKYKSRIILLYGNHEVQNLFRMIDTFKLENYNKSIKYNTIKEAREYSKKLNKLKDRMLCNYNSICIVNSYIFCHSGIVLKLIENLLESFNINFDNFIGLTTQDKLFIINICIVSLINYIISGKIDKLYLNNLKDIILDIFKTRQYVDIINDVNKLSDASKFRLTKNVMESNLLFNVKGMIIGHNTPINYKINNLDNLWCIDVKLSESFGKDIVNDVYQILKIKKGKEPKIVNIKNKLKNKK